MRSHLGCLCKRLSYARLRAGFLGCLLKSLGPRADNADERYFHAANARGASEEASLSMESVVPGFILDSVRSLPPLPASVGRLLEIACEPNVEFREIARVIELDQTLTARILRAANSAMYGVPRRVQTVNQATVLLGRDTIVNLALSISVMSAQSRVDTESWPIAPSEFWRHSFAVASLARGMAAHVPGVSPDECYVGGLLHDIGKMVMLDHFRDVYAQVVMAAQYGMKPLFMLERDVLETDHAAVGHALCLHWKIPMSITRAISEHHEENDPAPGTVADIVRNANDLAKAANVGNSGSQFAELRSSPRLPARQIPKARLHDLIKDLPENVASAEHAFGTAKDEPESSIGHDSKLSMHLHIEDLAERDFVRCVLWSLGYETDPVDDAFPPNPERVIGMLADGPLPGRTVTAYQSVGIPVLDYAAWRVGDGEPSDNHFNVVLLRQWLEQNLGVSSVDDQPAVVE